ncbi:hypothetical protein QOZ84_11150 [Romboutsia sedimentorum]|jgi:hypothetical protein|uniref:Uncharacterized protein n=1 Tax=Romboutsia sedimentorum TaxID=1368474 RepID=A0ABT7EAZ9_9FIRM|nr:hypothetical protein [Romboutsia sedimentorum]MDK2564107.1 hypothetical protein [Romboutsia sedimentorum]MDK2587423.1 hypothetical protein [Romboutsia sedimentorum]
MAKNKSLKKPKKSKNVANSNLEIAEELNIDPQLRPSKTGSVSQNTAKPIKPRKK